jgi:methyl-accepting chemotaxis protein
MRSSRIEKIIFTTLIIISLNVVLLIGLILYSGFSSKNSANNSMVVATRLKTLDQDIKHIQKISDGYFSFITGSADGLNTYNQIKKDITITKKKLETLGKSLTPKGNALVKQMQISFKKLTEVGEKMAIATISEEQDAFKEQREVFLKISKEVETQTNTLFNDMVEKITHNSTELESSSSSQLTLAYIFIVISLVILIFSARFLISKVREVLKDQAEDLMKEKAALESNLTMIVDKLKKNYIKLQSTVVDLDESSTSLSSSSTEQAAATEQAVAAMEEISSMVKQTNENGAHALDIANQAQDKVHEGQEVVTKLSDAMEEIHKSNNELSVIVNLINEITEKTKIINSIVVKTELLSFNASIEAARAAEYGKGFAVVAEEVGNLARLSGDSAKEIEYLLGESVLKVNEIVELIQSRVSLGQKRSQECVEVFKDINNLNNNLTSSVNSISTATNEQTKGVEQTTHAMNDISKAAQENLKVTQGTTTLSSTIKNEIEELNTSMLVLTEILEESKKKTIDTGDKKNNKVESKKSSQSKNTQTIGELSEDEFDPTELSARYNQGVGSNSTNGPQFDDNQFE